MAIMCKFHENLRIESSFLIGLVLCDPVEKNIRQLFFYFLVYGSSDPNFCILEKKKVIFDFFYLLRCKKLPDLKKKLNCKKKKKKKII